MDNQDKMLIDSKLQSVTPEVEQSLEWITRSLPALQAVSAERDSKSCLLKCRRCKQKQLKNPVGSEQ